MISGRHQAPVDLSRARWGLSLFRYDEELNDQSWTSLSAEDTIGRLHTSPKSQKTISAFALHLYSCALDEERLDRYSASEYKNFAYIGQ